MKKILEKFSAEKSRLKKLRLILISVLTFTVISSATLAIFMIITGLANETFYKVTGTFALFAGFSLIILLQTASLYREELVDKIVSLLGFISSFIIAFWGLDSIWGWNAFAIIFGDNYPLLGQTMSTVGFTIILTLIASLLRSSFSVKGKVKVTTFSLASLYYLLWQIRIWAPQWLSTEITDVYLDSEGNEQSSSYMQEIGFWSDTYLILGILLGTMLVVSLVNHILGVKKQPKDISGTVASELGSSVKDEEGSLISVKISEEAYKIAESISQKDGTDINAAVEAAIRRAYKDI